MHKKHRQVLMNTTTIDLRIVFILHFNIILIVSSLYNVHVIIITQYTIFLNIMYYKSLAFNVSIYSNITLTRLCVMDLNRLYTAHSIRRSTAG